MSCLCSMSPGELAIAVSALAAALAEGKSVDEITQLAVILTQLGDTMATIALQKNICCKKPQV